MYVLIFKETLTVFIDTLGVLVILFGHSTLGKSQEHVIYTWNMIESHLKKSSKWWKILCWAPDIVGEIAECFQHWADGLYTYFTEVIIYPYSSHTK